MDGGKQPVISTPANSRPFEHNEHQLTQDPSILTTSFKQAGVISSKTSTQHVAASMTEGDIQSNYTKSNRRKREKSGSRKKDPRRSRSRKEEAESVRLQLQSKNDGNIEEYLKSLDERTQKLDD